MSSTDRSLGQVTVLVPFSLEEHRREWIVHQLKKLPKMVVLRKWPAKEDTRVDFAIDLRSERGTIPATIVDKLSKRGRTMVNIIASQVDSFDANVGKWGCSVLKSMDEVWELISSIRSRLNLSPIQRYSTSVDPDMNVLACPSMVQEDNASEGSRAGVVTVTLCAPSFLPIEEEVEIGPEPVRVVRETKRPRTKGSSGYCELCERHYTQYNVHITEQRHIRKFNDSSWSKVNDRICSINAKKNF